MALRTVRFDGGEHAHQISVRIDPLLAEELGGVGVQFHCRRYGHVRLELILGVFASHHPIGPIEHLVAIVVRHARSSAMTCRGNSADKSVTKSDWPVALT